MPDRRRARAALAVLALLAGASALSSAQGAAGADTQIAQAVSAGRDALNRGDGISAEIDLRRAVSTGAPRPQVAALLGEAYLLQGDLDAAREWLGDGNFSPDQRQHGFYMLARLELAQNNIPAAEAAFDKALEGNPGTAAIWVDIGRMRYGNGQQHLALEAALKALERDPRDPRAIEFRGQLVRDAQGLAAALSWFERGLKSAPDDLSLLGEYAATLGELGRAKEMLVVTRRMIQLDAESPRAFYLQAVLAARAGNYNLARRLLWRTEGQFDDVPAKMMLEGILDMHEGNWALAVDTFDALSRRQPDNSHIDPLLGRALLENGDAREVVARYGYLAKVPDASPYMLTLVGRSYEVLGNRAAAAPYLDRAAAQQTSGVEPLPVGEDGELAIFRWGDDPYRLDAAVPKIRKLLASGASGQASALVGRLIERYPDAAGVQVLAGDVALARGNARTALDNYRASATIRCSFSLLKRMAAALHALGEDGVARGLVGDYLVQHPRDADAAKLLGIMMADKGDWQRARLLFEHVRDLREAGRDPQLFGLLAEAELALGDAPTALDDAAASYGMQRANGHSAAVLARVMGQAGRESEERALAAKASRLGFAGITK